MHSDSSHGGGTSGDVGGAAGARSAGYTDGGGFTTGDDFGAHEGGYRRHHAADRDPGAALWDEARAGYEMGHRAASDPTNDGRGFGDIEVELEDANGHRFAALRRYARHAFEWKMMLGALALAGGAWWASRRLAQAVAEMEEEEEQDCRMFYASHPLRATVPYDQARTVYVIGYAAARNPEYAGRGFDHVEPHLRRGLSGSRAGSYDSLRDFTRRGYERGMSRHASQRAV